MPGPYTEKGSCRWRHDKGRSSLDDFCPACKDHARHSNTKLRKGEADGSITITGACHKLHPDNAPPPPKRTRRAPAEPVEQSKDQRKVRAANNEEKGKFVAGPSGEAKLGVERKNNAVPNIHTCACPDRAVLRRVAASKEIDPSKVQVSTGGMSRADVSKQAKTAGACFTGVTKMIAPTDPHLCRNLAITSSASDSAKKSAGAARANIVSPPPVCPPCNSGRVPLTAAHRKDRSAARKFTDDAELRANEIAKSLREKQKLQRLEAAMGTDTISHVRELDTAAERRPILAAYASNHSGETVAQAIGKSISYDEWQRIRIHSRFPGPFKPTRKCRHCRERIKASLVKSLLAHLDEPGNLQCYAFGTELIKLMSSCGEVRLENVTRLRKLRDLTKSFLLQLDAEVTADSKGHLPLPPSNIRCQKLEPGTLRRCLCSRGHEGKCKYTPKGSMSKRTVEGLINRLTAGDIKRLSRLDDTKVLKGRDNFRKMSEIAEELCGGRHATEESLATMKDLKQNIEDTELYYLTDYSAHLRGVGDLKCNCLSCGFCDPNNADCTISCPDRDSHLNSCVRCALGYAVVKKLQYLQRDASRREGLSVLERAELEEYAQSIQQCSDNLTEYRSHLARHVSEAAADAVELETLTEDTAIVTCDYKMKLLACYFRENQLKWFGKRGTSCIGFMVLMLPQPENNADNSSDARAPVFLVEFAMMFTDDTIQDEWEVLCAKYVLYTSLASRVAKAIFRADGAGCFRNVLQRAVQPMWFFWTGIVEEVNRISPAGGGKSPLDSMFGRLTELLHMAVDMGHSYYDAASIMDATVVGGGLAATKFRSFLPDRTTRFFVRFATVSLNSVLRTQLQDDHSLLAFKHSGYGSGKRVCPFDDGTWYPGPKKPVVTGRKKTVPISSVPEDAVAVIVSNTATFLLPAGLEDEEDAPLTRRIISDIVNRCCFRVVLPPPRCKLLTEKANIKEEVQSFATEAGKGYSNYEARGKRRESRVTAACRVERDGELALREAKLAKKVYCCNVQCAETARFCEREFLTARGLVQHKVGGSQHTWERKGGVNSSDLAVLAASKPGGILRCGVRPDRAEKTVSLDVVVCADGASGAQEAECYGKFNRKEATVRYNKPPKLKSKLLELFNVGQDSDASRLNGEHAHQIMRKMTDPADGGLFFCWSKRGEVGLVPKADKARYAVWKCSLCGLKPCDCNGKLLSPAEIDSYFSYLAGKRKKQAVKATGHSTVVREEEAVEGQQQEGQAQGDPFVEDCEEIYNDFLTEELPVGDDVGI